MKTKKILIIDDDQDYRSQIRTFLESHNYSIVEAASGKDGLEKLAKENPDLIVLDIMMETDSEGYELNELIKYDNHYKEYKNIPILMVSSIQKDPHESFPRSEYADLITPDKYMTKPIDYNKFLQLVKELLNR